MKDNLKKAFDRYKGNDPFPLECLIPIDYTNDAGFCDELKSDINKVGTGWESIDVVHKDSTDLIPDKKGVYIFVWKPEPVLEIEPNQFSLNYAVYVGSSVTTKLGMRSRFLKEYSGIIGQHTDTHWTKKELIGRCDRLTKVLNLGRLAMFFNVMESASDNQILNIETRLISYFNPPGNKIGTVLKGRLAKAESLPAF